MEMHKEEKSLAEQYLWDAAHPIKGAESSLDPNTFYHLAGPSTYEVREATSSGGGNGSTSTGDSMLINKMNVPEIVKALSEAIAHARSVSVREHIKADRVERVNQFIVSLRRNFGYMSDKPTSDFLSAQLSRKEVWYDIGVLNPITISGDPGLTLKHRDVEGWLVQAEAMTPTSGDLKAEIERDLHGLRGSILVAESCNRNTVTINNSADKVLLEMAALVADM